MANVVFHRLARLELHAASAWYAARSEQTRQRFRRAVGDALDRICADPQARPSVVAPYRWERVR